MDITEYKVKVSRWINKELVREHARLHMRPEGGIIKHMVVVAEMDRRKIRHILHKDELDAKWQKTVANVGKKK